MNIILKVLLCIAVAHVSGCMATKATSEIGKKATLKDEIYSFLSYPDSSKLVVVGEKYHYFLDPDANLLKFLRIQNKPNLSVNLSDFKTDGKSISGKYKIYIHKEELDKNIIRALIDSGFEERPHSLVMLGEVSGNLHISSQLAIENTTNFKKRYELEIEQKPSTAATLTKLAISPLAIVADVGIVVAGTGIVLTAVPVLCISKDIIDIARGTYTKSCPSGF